MLLHPALVWLQPQALRRISNYQQFQMCRFRQSAPSSHCKPNNKNLSITKTRAVQNAPSLFVCFLFHWTLRWKELNWVQVKTWWASPLAAAKADSTLDTNCWKPVDGCTSRHDLSQQPNCQRLSTVFSDPWGIPTSTWTCFCRLSEVPLGSLSFRQHLFHHNHYSHAKNPLFKTNSKLTTPRKHLAISTHWSSCMLKDISLSFNIVKKTFFKKYIHPFQKYNLSINYIKLWYVMGSDDEKNCWTKIIRCLPSELCHAALPWGILSILHLSIGSFPKWTWSPF